MSQNIWTADALLSSAIPAEGECWRVAESQYVISTLKLTNGDVDKQTRLDEMIDAIKPAYPDHCARMHPLIKGSFRYPPYKDRDSRFRRKRQREGAYYGSALVETAVAEAAFVKSLFYAESPGTKIPENPTEHTAFKMKYKTRLSIDLNADPFRKNEQVWQDPVDYTACQTLADEARRANIEVILNNSVRCLRGGRNITVLKCDAFPKTGPDMRSLETWELMTRRTQVIAIRKIPRKMIVFHYSDWSFDPRMSAYLKASLKEV